MRMYAAFAAALLLVAASAADAHVTRIQIVQKESPTFGGYAFKDAGQYEKLVGKAYGELDPNDPKNAVIVAFNSSARSHCRKCPARGTTNGPTIRSNTTSHISGNAG